MTPKQEAFVREYLIDPNATQAAIRAGYSAKTAQEQGSRLLSNVMVSKALAKAQEKAGQAAAMTVDQHLADLKRIRDAAFNAEKFSAAATAEMARGKVAGFYVEQVKVDANVTGAVQYQANIPRRTTA